MSIEILGARIILILIVLTYARLKILGAHGCMHLTHFRYGAARMYSLEILGARKIVLA